MEGSEAQVTRTLRAESSALLERTESRKKPFEELPLDTVLLDCNWQSC